MCDVLLEPIACHVFVLLVTLTGPYAFIRTLVNKNQRIRVCDQLCRVLPLRHVAQQTSSNLCVNRLARCSSSLVCIRQCNCCRPMKRSTTRFQAPMLTAPVRYMFENGSFRRCRTISSMLTKATMPKIPHRLSTLNTAKVESTHCT
jgi:hypothetical protein